MEKSRLVHALEQQRVFAEQRAARPVVQRMLDISIEIEKPEISIITGVRRSGKSSYLTQLQRKFQKTHATLLVEFDNPALEGFGGSDFLLLTELCTQGSPTQKKLLLLDEIQSTSGWEKWLPQIAKDRSVKVVITGSNAQLLSSEFATLLTGRHASHEMTPLSFQEVAQFEAAEQGIDELTEDQLRAIYKKFHLYGGFPRAYVERDASVLPRYFQDIVERDVIVRHGSRLKRQLKELAQVLCSDNTHLINRSRLAKNLGVKDSGTINRYCKWLEESYLFHELKAFSPAIRKQIRSNPKYYCVDPAMARHSAFSVLGDEGSFLENAVYLELRRRGFDLYYWKASADDAEVDFVGRKAGRDPIAVQVSFSVADESTLRRELRGLEAINAELKIETLLLVTAYEPPRQLTHNGVKVEIFPFLRWAVDNHRSGSRAPAAT